MDNGVDFLSLLFGAVGLMLLLEGFAPLLSPKRWRQFFERFMRMSDGQIRFVGLCCVLSGAALIYMLLS